MILHVTKAVYIKDYCIEVWFNDGVHGIVNFADDAIFDSPMFSSLKSPETFRNFTVDPEINTIVWSNGADLAPEYIESKLVRQLT